MMFQAESADPNSLALKQMIDNNANSGFLNLNSPEARNTRTKVKLDAGVYNYGISK